MKKNPLIITNNTNNNNNNNKHYRVANSIIRLTTHPTRTLLNSRSLSIPSTINLTHSHPPISFHHLHPSQSINQPNNQPSSSSTHKTPIIWTHLNNPVKYRDGLQLQTELVRHKIDHLSSLDWLLLLEHQPVYTTGRRQSNRNNTHHQQSHQPIELEFKRLETLNPTADLFPTLRGGQTTFHGPGQLVVYPILNLGLMNWNTRIYVDFLISLIRSILLHPSLPRPIETLDPKEQPDLPVGIFIKSEATKLASVGVQIKRRITSHGFALNVEKESEEGFKFIVACGLKNTKLVSLQSILEEQASKQLHHQIVVRGENAVVDHKTKEIKVFDLILPTVELFGKMSGREMKQMDDSCRALDPIGYQLVHQFMIDSQARTYKKKRLTE